MVERDAAVAAAEAVKAGLVRPGVSSDRQTEGGRGRRKMWFEGERYYQPTLTLTPTRVREDRNIWKEDVVLRGELVLCGSKTYLVSMRLSTAGC